MGITTKKVPGQDISHLSHGLFPEYFYEEDYDDLEYDDESVDSIEIDYTTQS
tara:strand:+ start:447 stop:602 length:156 start_codon:yes stop_codon:yes gene_type:complete